MRTDPMLVATARGVAIVVCAIGLLLGATYLVAQQFASPTPSHSAMGVAASADTRGQAAVGSGTTGQTPAAATRPSGSAGSPASDFKPPDVAANEPGVISRTDGPGVHVQWPDEVLLDGTLIPLGQHGVTSDGARAFARKLTARLLGVYGGRLTEDAQLDGLAEQALVEQFRHGYPWAATVQNGSAVVRFEQLAVLPDQPSVRLVALPVGAHAVGVAVGVAERVESPYLPDLVVLAAVAYQG
jgi:hypothetical protein